MSKEAVNKTLQEFLEEYEALSDSRKMNGGILLFLPGKELYVRLQYGSGDNLLDEDIKEGYDDYINIVTFSYDCGFDEGDGGMILLKMKKDFNGRYNICQHVDDVLYQIDCEGEEIIPLHLI